MKVLVILAAGIAAGAIVLAIPVTPQARAANAASTGIIKGHVHLTGKLPGNPVIRMGMDPKCSQMNAGKMTVQENVVVTIDGSLGNVFVALQGSFPATPVPTQAAMLDQRGCIYRPRVIGMRAGQMLQVHNSDELMHNVHASSARGNTFNISEPKAGMVQKFQLKDEEAMVHISCDVHRWMTAYVGVVSHPYFAVTDPAGNFAIANVPAGSVTIRAWHEKYGFVSKTVRVMPGATASVDFAYSGDEKARRDDVRELRLSADAMLVRWVFPAATSARSLEVR